MMNDIYVFHPGHYGEDAQTVVGPDTQIQWDQPVKFLPEEIARSLIRDCGLCEAVTLKDASKKLGLPQKVLKDFDLKECSYKHEDGKTAVLIVLDRDLLRKARAEKKKGGDK